MILFLILTLTCTAYCTLDDREDLFMKTLRIKWSLEQSEILHSEDPCTWRGILCTSQNPQHILSIDWLTVGLKPKTTIMKDPGWNEIDVLQYLQIFGLRSGSEFRATLPSSFGNLKDLEVLRLDVPGLFFHMTSSLSFFALISFISTFWCISLCYFILFLFIFLFYFIFYFISNYFILFIFFLEGLDGTIPAEIYGSKNLKNLEY
jgi:hypothetical protein